MVVGPHPRGRGASIGYPNGAGAPPSGYSTLIAPSARHPLQLDERPTFYHHHPHQQIVHHAPLPAPPTSIINPRKVLEEQVETLINALEPCKRSEERRLAVYHFVRSILEERFPCVNCHMMGSFPLKAYLADSDLDITITTCTCRGCGERNDDRWLIETNQAMCMAALGPSPRARAEGMQIQNVSFVNARTKVINCRVMNIAVDLTINQRGGLASLALLEEVDRSIGCNHLFKRSLLLIKAWCLHESSKYVGTAILGSNKANGGLSSYALSVMVLALFDENGGGGGGNFRAPLQVFIRFFQVYSSFEWNKYVLTIEGPVLIGDGAFAATAASPSCRRKAGGGNPSSHFSALVDRLKQHYNVTAESPTSNSFHGSSTSTGTSSFPIRCCNIQDPLNASNNLGYSLNHQSLHYLQHALTEGRRHLEYLLGSPLPNHQTDQGVIWDPPLAFAQDGGIIGGMPSAATLPPTSSSPSSINGLPTMPLGWNANALTMSFFPKLYQIYLDPNVRRSDLLNHPCESRTTVVYDNSPPRPNKHHKQYLTGDVTSFWRALARAQDSHGCGKGDSCSSPGLEEIIRGSHRGTRSSSVASSSCCCCTYSCSCTNQTAPLTSSISFSPSSSVSSFSSEPPSTPTRDESSEEDAIEEEEREGGREEEEEHHQQQHRQQEDEDEDDCIGEEKQVKGIEVVEEAVEGGQSNQRAVAEAETSTFPLNEIHPATMPSDNNLVEEERTEQSPQQQGDAVSSSHDEESKAKLDKQEERTKEVAKEIDFNEMIPKELEKIEEDSVMKFPASSTVSPRPSSAPCLDSRRDQESSTASLSPTPSLPCSEAAAPAPASCSTLRENKKSKEKGNGRRGGKKAASSGNGRVEEQQGQARPEKSSSLGSSAAAAKRKQQGVGQGPVVERRRGSHNNNSSNNCSSRGRGREEKGEISSTKPTTTTEARNRSRTRSASPSPPAVLLKKVPLHRLHQRSRRRKWLIVRMVRRFWDVVEWMMHRELNTAGKVLSLFGLGTMVASLSFLLYHYHCSQGMIGREDDLLTSYQEGRRGEAVTRTPEHAPSYIDELVASLSPPVSPFDSHAYHQKQPEEGKIEALSSEQPLLLSKNDASRSTLTTWVTPESTIHLSCAGEEGENGEGSSWQQQQQQKKSSSTVWTWARDGKLIQDSSPNPSYLISKVSPADEGVYICYRQKDEEGGLMEQMGRTRVRISSPPVLSPKKPRCQMLLEPGSLLALSIAAEGQPLPQFQWMLNGSPIDGAVYNTYTVSAVNVSHAGTYTAKVWNMAGEVVWEEAVVGIALSQV